MEISFIISLSGLEEILIRGLRDGSDFQGVNNRLKVVVDGLKSNLSDHLDPAHQFEIWFGTAMERPFNTTKRNCLVNPDNGSSPRSRAVKIQKRKRKRVQDFIKMDQASIRTR